MDVQDKEFEDEFKENSSVQSLNFKQGKPTKYRPITPTLAADLYAHNPAQYRDIPDHLELDHLGEDDMVKIAYINREDIWLFVERVDEETEVIYAKVAQRVRKVNELQEGQRVTVRKEHVCEIKFHDAHEDSD
ncbi:hypothetical protein WJX75_001632 [Coccomyxa subellipsoidea]|uniref:Uncharacterized protein n=1 Tax=Coccomyxa subellipsoidea TaxID=248742 RepID=A0ABR2YKK6_9CHLO